MKKDTARIQRVAQEIKKNVATILQHKIKDPRIRMITTVSDVIISYDLRYVRIYLTFLNNENDDEIKNHIQIFQQASGYIRTLISRSMNLRLVPELMFFYDNSLIKGIRVSNLLNRFRNVNNIKNKNRKISDK